MVEQTDGGSKFDENLDLRRKQNKIQEEINQTVRISRRSGDYDPNIDDEHPEQETLEDMQQSADALGEQARHNIRDRIGIESDGIYPRNVDVPEDPDVDEGDLEDDLGKKEQLET